MRPGSFLFVFWHACRMKEMSLIAAIAYLLIDHWFVIKVEV